MRGKKFISLTLSTMLCLQLLPTASFAAAPATDTGKADNHSVPHRGVWAYPDEQAFSIGRASGWRAGGSGLQPYFM